MRLRAWSVEQLVDLKRSEEGNYHFGRVQAETKTLTILWMDEILHRFETMGSHCLLVFTGESFIPGFLRWCEMDFVHPQYFGGLHWMRSQGSQFILGKAPLKMLDDTVAGLLSSQSPQPAATA